MVPVDVGVKVGVEVRLPVGVGVKLEVGVVPVEVGVNVGVEVRLPVTVGVKLEIDVVDVEVGVAEPVITARLRKMTIVCDAAVPSTILTVTSPPTRSLLINRSAGMV